METLSKSQPNQFLSKMLHASIYYLLAISMLLQMSNLGVGLKEFIVALLGSSITVFLPKLFAAASGSVSGARAMKTASSQDFWIKVGVGVSVSLVFSPTVHGFLPKTIGILPVYFILGSSGILIVKMITDFFRSLGGVSDEIGQEAGKSILSQVKRFRFDKNKKTKTD